MFSFFKKWIESRKHKKMLEARRHLSRCHIRDKGDFFVYRHDYDCYLCRERTVELWSKKNVISPAGETFEKLDERVAVVCFRCMSASPYFDGSGGIPLQDWDGKRLARF